MKFVIDFKLVVIGILIDLKLGYLPTVKGNVIPRNIGGDVIALLRADPKDEPVF
jgi:hypothetical protein